MTERSFADILDECLDRVTMRGESIDTVVAEYPEHAQDLRQALSTAMAVRKAASFTPSADAKRAARLRLHDAIERRQIAAAKASPVGLLRDVLWGGRRLATAAAVVAAVLLGGAGTVVASTSSVPGDALYPVKRAAEQAQLPLAFTDSREAGLHAKLLDRRVHELQVVTEEERTRFVPGLAERIEHHADRADRLVVAPVDHAVADLPSMVALGNATEAPPAHTPGAVTASRPATAEIPADRLLELNQQMVALETKIAQLEAITRDACARAALERLTASLRERREQLLAVLRKADSLHRTPITITVVVPTPTPATASSDLTNVGAEEAPTAQPAARPSTKPVLPLPNQQTSPPFTTNETSAPTPTPSRAPEAMPTPAARTASPSTPTPAPKREQPPEVMQAVEGRITGVTLVRSESGGGILLKVQLTNGHGVRVLIERGGPRLTFGEKEAGLADVSLGVRVRIIRETATGKVRVVQVLTETRGGARLDDAGVGDSVAKGGASMTGADAPAVTVVVVQPGAGVAVTLGDVPREAAGKQRSGG
ncbi:MAG: hypothetical protein FJ318_02035 [SAR202 cluster bacterium]|nr:hypothetical protein [SAR202 cluster bacterium]